MIVVLTEHEGRFGIYGRTLQISHVPVHGLERRNSGTRKYENCTVLTLFYPGAFPRGLAQNKGKT